MGSLTRAAPQSPRARDGRMRPASSTVVHPPPSRRRSDGETPGSGWWPGCGGAWRMERSHGTITWRAGNSRTVVRTHASAPRSHSVSPAAGSVRGVVDAGSAARWRQVTPVRTARPSVRRGGRRIVTGRNPAWCRAVQGGEGMPRLAAPGRASGGMHPGWRTGCSAVSGAGEWTLDAEARGWRITRSRAGTRGWEPAVDGVYQGEAVERTAKAGHRRAGGCCGTTR